MKKMLRYVLLSGVCLALASCGVPNATHQALQDDYEKCLDDASKSANTVKNQSVRIASLEDQVDLLRDQNEVLKENLKGCALNNSQGASNIEKLINQIRDSQQYINRLQDAKSRQDSIMVAISNNLKRALVDVSDDDLEIKVQKGVVFVSLSDKILYESASYAVTSSAENVLRNVAKVLNDYSNYEVLVEGHTDVDPMRPNALVKDNWDLSVLRATSVVRLLQTKFGVDPSRMTAGGRSQYVPKYGLKSQNRRTEIIILPNLDQFFQLINAD